MESAWIDPATQVLPVNGFTKRFITGAWQQDGNKGPFRVIANYGL